MHKTLRIKKSVLNRWLFRLTVLSTILMSKSYYFGVANKGTYQYIYVFVIVLFVLTTKLKTKKLFYSIGVVSPLLLLMVANLGLNRFDMTSSDVNRLAGIVIFIITSAIYASVVEIKDFAREYIRIMSVIAIISIPCFVLALISPETALTFCQPGYNWRVPVGYSFFYTWGWNGWVFSRNSGPFWEPGAYQGFLVLALLFLINNVDKGGVKNRKKVLILLLATILTTRSSAGYIILLIIVFTHWNEIQKVYGDISKSVRYILIAVLLIGIVAIIIQSGNISDKLTNANSNSAAIRMNDFIGGLYMCIRGGILGLGETAQRNQLRALLGVNMNDSVGLLAMTYTYGIIFSIYYIFIIYKGFVRSLNPRTIFKEAIILFIFTILQMTEGLWSLPVYLTVPLIGLTSGQARYYRAYGYKGVKHETK